MKLLLRILSNVLIGERSRTIVNAKLGSNKNSRFFKVILIESSLKTHKLSGRLQELWSFSVEYDLRIVFYFAEENKVVLVDIGTHDEVY